MAIDPDNRAAPDWLRPEGEQTSLGYYAQIVRERIWIVVLIILVTLSAGAAYLLTADDVYEAEATLLITPASRDDVLLGDLRVLRESTDPTRAIQTAASLAAGTSVAERARQELDLDDSVRSLQRRVKAEPVASSDLVAITAEAPTAAGAADLANAFADAFIAEQTAKLHAEIDAKLPQLERELERGGATGITPESTLEADIARLQSLSAQPDPTVSVAEPATPPRGPASPRALLTLVGSLIAGTVIGIAGAFAAQTFDVRLRREAQLRNRFSLPILARIPKESGRSDRPLGPAALSPPAREAYRTLRANVTAARRNPRAPQSVLITGSSPSEGKTTTAINLASSLAMAGNRVILIEADLRRPAIGKALGIEVETGVVSTMLDNVSLNEALVTTPVFSDSLKLLLADYAGGWMSELFSLHAAQRLLDAAKRQADYVIVDSPPLTTVLDTLPLARQADQVIIVTRLGVSRLDKLPELAELLASNGITPLGFALIGTNVTESSYYYTEEEPDASFRAPRRRPRSTSAERRPGSREPESEPARTGTADRAEGGARPEREPDAELKAAARSKGDREAEPESWGWQASGERSERS